ncbi:hypothetical protein [uncultured Alistipes sp.]|jgi:hypothetical protein|uniref:hypothetical protein n=1 Tax=uncultured Alistipes sp. TaxID=538949 RepID=UPI0025D90DE0|nr:hypothetical protein [uncultured Alistipes sp.]
MKAKEHLKLYKTTIDTSPEISRLIDELSEIRHDKEATQQYYYRNLAQDPQDADYQEWLELHKEFGALALEPDQPITVKQELLKVIGNDDSFGFITALLTSQEPTPEIIYKSLLEELMLSQPVNVDSSDVDERSTDVRTMKVTTDAIVEMLKKLNVIKGNNADATKISELISCITGYSSETIRQRLSNTEELTKRHKREVDKINQLFSELNLDITIQYNKLR